MNAKRGSIVVRLLAALAAWITAAGFSHPAWAQTDADNNYFVTGNYFAVLGRYPDSAGWIWNKAALVGGLSRTDFTNNFLASQEYILENGPSPDVNVFVTDLYEDALLRTPSGAEVSAWANLIVPLGSLTRAQVVDDLSTPRNSPITPTARWRASTAAPGRFRRA